MSKLSWWGGCIPVIAVVMLRFDEKIESIFLAPSSNLRNQNYRIGKEIENTFLCD